MDTFEEFSQKLASMDAKGRDRMIAEQKDHCVCSGCPTYNECMREKSELCYCILGRSPTCAFEKKGCICPTCPLKVTLGLSKSYYCIKGSEQEQRVHTHIKKDT
jgi:hypothetical protein